jgi:DNA-binding MarR family transcriptional regulator
MDKQMSLYTKEARAAWRSFLQTYATLLPILAQELQAEHKLPLTWYDVLAQLNSAPDGVLRMQDLAKAILLSQSGLTRLLDRIAAAGLVERLPCPDDRRGTYAVITEQGKEVLAQALPSHIRSIETHFLSHLDAADIQALHTAFAKILAAEKDA